jgi:type II secretory pathway predicted ATPase ExeA
MLDELIEEFSDRINLSDYYSYVHFEIIKETIISSKSNIVFILGDSGTGKTFLLNYLYHNLDYYTLIKEPFETRAEFVKIVRKEGKRKILIDEAQLLDIKMLEYLRTVSDRGYQIILAMHKDEGEKIAKLPQFFSRYNEKVYLKPLSYEEFEKYVKSKFLKHNKLNLIDDKMLKKIYKLCKGNFRLCKKIVFTALELLNFAIKNHLKYTKIDDCIFTMSKIKLELK